MNHNTILLTLLLPALLLGGCGTTSERDASEQLVRPPESTVPTVDQQEKPDLTGNWLLNREQSDDANKLAMNLFKGGRGNKDDRRGGMGAERKGHGEQTGNMQGSADSEDMQRDKADQGPQKLRQFIYSAELLAIKHHDPSLLITSDRYSKQIYTDMRSTPISAKGRLDQNVFIAYWKGDVLTVETTVDPDTRVFQYYKLHESRRQLWLSTSIQMQTVERPVFFNTVYDIATSSESRGIMM